MGFCRNSTLSKVKREQNQMPKLNEKQDLISQVLSIRILVLTLGESRHTNWWKSEFLSPTGLSFFTRLYPRSTFAQAIMSTTRSALELHDSSIGKGSVFHLFRLSNEMEFGINEYLFQNSKGLEKEFSKLSDDRDKLLNLLSSQAAQKSDFKGGPVQIKVDIPNLPSAMATAYSWAFRNNKQVFPYFV